jgi:transcriptional regulator GlxA family with amidase domain
MTRSVALVIFPGFQLLDAAGPIAVFEIASLNAPDAYRLAVLAPDGGQVASSSGIALSARPLDSGPYDTVMIVGGDGTRALPELNRIVTWVRNLETRRPTSVCSGAYLLAEAGLLDGRRATTHWSRTDDFARRYPKVKVDADRIYIRDGHVWTSGGITAGIDLALALVEEDLGPEIARRTAQQLVVHQRRPGGQSQFSGLLDLGGRSGRFDTLLAWMGENLSTQLTVETLADQAAMSPRNFARAFVAETGVTPAKAVERLRLDAARTAVETGREPLDQVAVETGFADPERMRRAFLRAFGQPPQALRRAARA